ncbi:cupin domain-containing protein [Clostridium vincentii]|uniref:Cupin domain protein n=1 Tax=Clostridium vincentii TaxID=52704 RepID=A0A2T0B9A2_9CLOT|nr:cupin domain-containing protein [Clostridium vincentii]PRR80377.1 Cupin domain protein [Clostridium vincentii]
MATSTKVLDFLKGGKGPVIIKYLLGDNELKGKCELYAEITLKPGCSIGYHEHTNEIETYYIISGEGEYTNNEVLTIVKAGDVTFTSSGNGHGIENIGNSDLVFIALIIK